MNFRIKTSICTIIAALSFATTARANPLLISAIAAPEMMQVMQGAKIHEREETACIALAVYHEAFNQSTTGQRAVAHVIMNRMHSGKFASTACGVVFQRGQFSFIHYNRKKILPHPSSQWNDIVRLVREVEKGNCADPTSGAMYFYNPKISHPHWRNIVATTKIGAHLFVRV